MKHFKRSIYVVLLLGLVLAALYFIPVRRNIDMSLPCVMWDENDPTVGELEGVEIKGRYYDYLIKDDYFRGSVRISEVNDYEEELDMELFFSDVYDMQRATGHYFSRVHRRTVILGSLYMQGTFDKILIFPSGDGQNVHLADKVISAPATTIEEAVAIAEAMHFA